MRRPALLAAAVLLAGLGLAACGSDDNGGTIGEGGGGDATTAKQVTLTAKDTSYDQTSIQLVAGEDIQFVLTNQDTFEHNITVEDLEVHVDAEGGKTAKGDVVRSVKAGTYEYHCEYHPDRMKGTITVT